MRCPGIEPGSQAWKASMITTTLATLHIYWLNNLGLKNKHICRVPGKTR